MSATATSGRGKRQVTNGILENVASAAVRWLVAGLCCLALAGCKSMAKDAADKKKDDGDAGWAAGMREPGPKGQATGLDPRAREIERHLGVR